MFPLAYMEKKKMNWFIHEVQLKRKTGSEK